MVCAVALPARSAPQVETGGTVSDQLLRRFISAGRGVNLRGRQTVLSTSPQGAIHTTINRVVRTRDGRCMAVCLEPAAQRGTVTIDDGQWRRRYDPRQRVVKSTRSVPRPNDERAILRILRLIRRNYQVVLKGRESFAGRPCYVLQFEPRDRHSRIVKVWIDSVTGVVLCRQESDAHTGSTISLVMFTEIEYPRRLAAAESHHRFPPGTRFATMSRSPILRDVGRLRRLANFEIFQPLWMPGGYEFENCELISLNGALTTCLRYTDGLGAVTVFQTRAPEPRPPGFRAGGWSRLPLGEAMIAIRWGQMDITVLGNREIGGLEPVVRALDNRRERAYLSRLERSFRVAPATLTAMRNQGMGIDTMGTLLEAATRSGRPLGALRALYEEGGRVGPLSPLAQPSGR